MQLSQRRREESHVGDVDAVGVGDLAQDAGGHAGGNDAGRDVAGDHRASSPVTDGGDLREARGAVYGVDAVPQRWHERVVRGDEILALADALFAHAHADARRPEPLHPSPERSGALTRYVNP